MNYKYENNDSFNYVNYHYSIYYGIYSIYIL